jgi:hypothetical protein
MLYAIGEIILVVIGILIALQINNWNELKKEKKQTNIYVYNLMEDLNKDNRMYKDQINAARLKYQFSKEINSIINENKVIVDTSAFIINLQSAGRLIVPTITDNTYKDLVSTGNLKLINDKNSIDAIREYYSNPLGWWYEDYKDQLVNGYLPVVVDAIPMDLHEEILENEMVDSFKDFTDKALLNNEIKGYTRGDVIAILGDLRKNEEFSFQLKRITRSHLVQLKILSLSEKSANALLTTLEEWKKSN